MKTPSLSSPPMVPILRACLILLVLVIPVSPLQADPSGDWSDLFWRNDLEASVNAVASYDGELVVGGDLMSFYGNVAVSDGHVWSQLGTIVEGTVLCLQIFEDDLYCGGYSESGGSPEAFLMVLSGTTWVDAASPLAGSRVADMHVVGGELIVAGDLSQIAGLGVDNIAAYDGSAWWALGDGLRDSVTCLTSEAGVLYAGGDFTIAGGATADYIASWTGTEWVRGATSLGEVPNAIAWYGGELYAGTGLIQSCVPGAPAPLRKLEGAVWVEVGGGLFEDRDDCCQAGVDPCYNGVRDLMVDGGKLYVAGYFTKVGSGPSALGDGYIVAWNGTGWESLDGGIKSFSNYRPFDRVEALGLYRGAVVAGGGFDTAGGAAAVSVALWDGNRWLATEDTGMGVHTGIKALCPYDGDLYATGFFYRAGTVGTRGIARWDGSLWHDVGGGIDGDGNGNALVEYEGDLVMGGHFQSVGGVTATNLARWDGVGWSPFTAGTTVDSTVAALLVVGDSLVVGGHFTHAGGNTANRIVVWDGSTWQPLGMGFDDAWVMSLANHRGDIIAGGSFYSAGGLVCQSIARWDGLAWQNMGNADCIVMTLLSDGTTLFAGGCFWGIGGASAHGIGRWDGVQWHDMNNGFSNTIGVLPIVKTMAVFEGRFLAGGAFNFEFIGGPARSLVFWDGTGWTEFAGGLGGLAAVLSGPTAMVEWNGDLYVAGEFLSAGPTLSVDIARWESDGSAMTPVSEPPPASPALLTLDPNPANPRTMIRFELPASSPVTLDVFDARGHRVRRLLDEERSAGPHAVPWDGQDRLGRPTTSGTYLVRLRAGELVESGKLNLVR
jgi:trimeric autotransporter adhesin